MGHCKVLPTQACDQHQLEWKKYVENHSQENLSGVRRILRSRENMPWQPNTISIPLIGQTPMSNSNTMSQYYTQAPLSRKMTCLIIMINLPSTKRYIWPERDYYRALDLKMKMKMQIIYDNCGNMILSMAIRIMSQVQMTLRLGSTIVDVVCHLDQHDEYSYSNFVGSDGAE